MVISTRDGNSAKLINILAILQRDRANLESLWTKCRETDCGSIRKRPGKECVGPGKGHMEWYKGQSLENNNKAEGQLKTNTTHKTKKENLKPRKPSSPRVQFLQGNLQKSQTGQIEINKRISQLNKKGEKFVCLIQEPYTSPSIVILQPNSVQKFAAKGVARAAIYISKNTPAWYIEFLSNKDLVVVQTKLDQQEVLLVSAYMDIKNRTLETSDLAKLLDFASKRDLGLIIGMDSNCHSTLFRPKQNQRGYLFDELMGLLHGSCGYAVFQLVRARGRLIEISLFFL